MSREADKTYNRVISEFLDIQEAIREISDLQKKAADLVTNSENLPPSLRNNLARILGSDSYEADGYTDSTKSIRTSYMPEDLIQTYAQHLSDIVNYNGEGKVAPATPTYQALQERRKVSDHKLQSLGFVRNGELILSAYGVNEMSRIKNATPNEEK